MKSIYSVIKAPLVTEKSSRHSVYRKYSFLVSNDSNKVEIKRSIEKIYKVKVDKISSMIIKGKIKKIKWNQPGKTVNWKKAVITLKPGFEIKLT
ncbi:MAG: 50S ribosomal protein L23 [Candidatus Omnitrophica bacterium]|nr:50S ribosomal protein L23 [Candidatus Omnitrophota bacterium]